jgi:hypothetical protein
MLFVDIVCSFGASDWMPMNLRRRSASRIGEIAAANAYVSTTAACLKAGGKGVRSS